MTFGKMNEIFIWIETIIKSNQLSLSCLFLGLFLRLLLFLITILQEPINLLVFILRGHLLLALLLAS